MTTVFNTATDEHTIRLILEVTREADDSFSISLEDEHFPEGSDERFIDGISEGYLFDAAEAALDAGRLASDYLGRGRGTWEDGPRSAPAIDRIAVPMEFKPSGE